MRKSRFSETRIISMIKEQEAGMPTAEVRRKHGLSPNTFYKFKQKYGGTNASGRGEAADVGRREHEAEAAIRGRDA